MSSSKRTDWAKVIEQLVANGHSKAELSRLCGVTPTTISDLANGICKNTDYHIGAVLMGLLQEPSAPAVPAGPTSVTVQVGGLEVTITVRQL